MIPRAQGNVSLLRVVSSAGAGATSNGAPSGVNVVRSLLTNLASRMAPSTLISPAPCSNMFEPDSGCAVYIKMAFTRLGVRVGFACSSKAAVPVTIGVAIYDPLIYINRPFETKTYVAAQLRGGAKR